VFITPTIESGASAGQLEELKKAHTEIEKVLELTNKQRSSLEQEGWFG